MTVIVPERKVWSRQPLPEIPINWSLIGSDAFVFHGGLNTALRFANKTVYGVEPASNGSTVTSPDGIARVFSNTGVNAGLDFGSLNPFTSNTQYTVLIVAAPIAEANARVAISQRYGTSPIPITGYAGFNLSDINTITAGYISTGSNGDSASSVSAANQIDGKVHSWVLSNSTSKGYI